jgi:hypothetical protein
MDYIESQGFCYKCNKPVITRRKLPTLTLSHRILTLLSFGFWPLYLIRIGWHCAECGTNADNEKVHLVGRRMGGLRVIDAITSQGYCEKCGKVVMIRRGLPPASSLHQRLSFLTAGAWPSSWIQTGWHCGDCGADIDLDIDSDFEEIIVSRGYCGNCGDEGPIRRRVLGLSYHHKILSLFTAGAWPFYWMSFGWRCYKCGHMGDDVDALNPEEYIEIYDFCKKCGKVVAARRNIPTLNFMHRVMAILTLGIWPFFWIRNGWKCTQCEGRVQPKLFTSVKPDKTDPAS